MVDNAGAVADYTSVIPLVLVSDRFDRELTGPLSARQDDAVAARSYRGSIKKPLYL